MLFSNDRTELRQVFFNAWQKRSQNATLDAMEKIIVSVIQQHPEYHSFFSNISSNLDKDFSPELGQVNPFLHLSMHISIHEQLSVNQPIGIMDAYKKLLEKTRDAHDTEHILMDCLGEMIWKAQRDNTTPDEKVYFNCIQQRSKN